MTRRQFYASKQINTKLKEMWGGGKSLNLKEKLFVGIDSENN
jgi:hypothetical protein